MEKKDFGVAKKTKGNSIEVTVFTLYDAYLAEYYIAVKPKMSKQEIKKFINKQKRNPEDEIGACNTTINNKSWRNISTSGYKMWEW